MKFMKFHENEKKNEILFDAIMNRNGRVPKREKKLFTRKFLNDFLKYTHDKYGSEEYSKTIATVFKDFGNEFLINNSNIRYVGRHVDIFRYVRLSYSDINWHQYISVEKNNADELINLYTRASYIFITTESLDIENLASFFSVMYFITDGDNIPFIVTIYEKIYGMILEDGNPIDRTLKERIIIASILSCPDTSSKLALKCFAKWVLNKHSEMDLPEAPILPMYYTLFDPNEYAEICIKYGFKVDDETFRLYINELSDEPRRELLIRLTAVNCNNVLLCKDETDAIACLPAIKWNREKHRDIDYKAIRTCYPRSVPVAINDAFLTYGDFSTVTNESIVTILDDPRKINTILSRPDGLKQIKHIFESRNGIIYIQSAIDHILPENLITFINGYCDYMETYGMTMGSISIEMFIAAYIKSNVSMNLIIKNTPRLLRYIDTKITDYPDQYDNPIEWVGVLSNAPAINIITYKTIDVLIKSKIYVPINYKYIPFDTGEFGIEDLANHSKTLISLIEAIPGYYFDITSSEVRDIIMEYLLSKR